MEIRKVFMQGRSLAVVLPKKYCKALHVRLGDHMVVTIAKDGGFRVEKVQRKEV
ncbi:hypothetical protein ES703_25774 [subsurface metagenome]